MKKLKVILNHLTDPYHLSSKIHISSVFGQSYKKKNFTKASAAECH